MKVAVIGGGIGGLAVAYELRREPTRSDLEVHVFDAGDRFGGVADTKQFTFYEGPVHESPRKTTIQNITRWADLGVNDFNKSAYTNIVRVMNEIGFTDYDKLEDSTSYYKPDNSKIFTDNGVSWWGTAMDPLLKKSVTDFMATAAKDAEHPAYKRHSLQQYIKEKASSAGWHADLGPLVIFPRVNAMYFTNSDPKTMPFCAIMHYYKIQEGAGGEAVRMYFVGGASAWIGRLKEYMEQCLKVTFHSNFKVSLSSNQPGWIVFNGTQPPPTFAEPLEFDAVVIATHADDALKILETDTASVSRKASSIMKKVKYEESHSVAHVDTRLMPANQNAWCTYNIVIRDVLGPYAINYVANRHQNDAANSIYNKFGLPQFFVSVNPLREIPAEMVLAQASQRHNIFDFDCIEAQGAIESEQGNENLYFAGGWTHGAGLHEECWQQGVDIANKILGRSVRPKSEPVSFDAYEFMQDRLRASAATA